MKDSADLPDPPANIPAYVVEPVSKQSPARLRDLAAWIDHLANAKENRTFDEFEERVEEIEHDDQSELVEQDSGGAVYQRMVDCNKDACSACPHGPYRFRTYREDGKVKTEHLGRAGE